MGRTNAVISLLRTVMKLLAEALVSYVLAVLVISVSTMPFGVGWIERLVWVALVALVVPVVYLVWVLRQTRHQHGGSDDA